MVALFWKVEKGEDYEEENKSTTDDAQRPFRLFYDCSMFVFWLWE